jgi:hypothetical protein
MQNGRDSKDVADQPHSAWQESAISVASGSAAADTSAPRPVPSSTSTGASGSSAEDALEGEVPLETGRCSYIRAHLGRLFKSNIQTVKLLPHEKSTLLDRKRLGLRSSQYAAWRCTLLANGTVFFAVIVSMNLLFLFDPWNTGTEGSQHFLLKHVAQRYHEYFDELQLLNHIHSIILTVTSCFAVVLSAIAFCNWYSVKRSEHLVQLSFSCSFFATIYIVALHSVSFCRGFQGSTAADVHRCPEWHSGYVFVGK